MIHDVILGKDDSNQLNIDPSRTIFWTGAGISCIPPSCLPLGSRLTDAYLEAALGPYWKEFVALWNNHFPQIRDAVKDGKWFYPAPVGGFTAADVGPKGAAWERPRLEYIIGEMDKLDKYFNSIKFKKTENQELFHRSSSLAAITNFQIEPCLYHYRLADLSKAGAVMVTANFDDGIEKALGVNPTKVITKYGTTAIENGCGNYVYHFHGISTDDSDKLGATIYNMSKGLNENFQNYIIQCFESGYNIVFIGYGGVDFFDVAPFFKELAGKNYLGKAIYFHYAPTDRAKEKSKEKVYEYLLSPFKNQYIAYGDTDEFFQTIWNLYTPITPGKCDCEAFKATTDYLQSVVNSQADKNTYYFINLFRFCSQLNINPGRLYPDWINRISDLFKMWVEDGADTLKNMSIIDGQKNDGIIDDIFSNNWQDDKLEATGMARKLKPYMDGWDKKHQTVMLKFNKIFKGLGCRLPQKIIRKNVDETIEILKHKKTDEASADISRGTVFYLCGWQTKGAIFLYQKTHGLFKRRMLFLKQCIEDLLQFPFTRFRYRTHYLSLCRQLVYINAALHNGKAGYEGDIQKEWDICMQTPNLFDAGQVLQARIIEAQMYGLQDGVDELKAIRQRILNLRKE